jgi:hypothetical protein
MIKIDNSGKSAVKRTIALTRSLSRSEASSSYKRLCGIDTKRNQPDYQAGQPMKNERSLAASFESGRQVGLSRLSKAPSKSLPQRRAGDRDVAFFAGAAE